MINKVTVSLAYLTIIQRSAADELVSASSFLQPFHNQDDESLVDPDLHTLDDFNVDGNIETADDWFSDQHIVELSQKNPTKVSEAMAIEVNLL